MPCFTQQSSVVELGQQTDWRLLAEAIKGLGYSVVKVPKGFYFTKAGGGGAFEDNKLEVYGNDSSDMNKFKRAYSAEVVKAATKRFGWQVKETKENQFQVTRRV